MNIDIARCAALLTQMSRIVIRASSQKDIMLRIDGDMGAYLSDEGALTLSEKIDLSKAVGEVADALPTTALPVSLSSFSGSCTLSLAGVTVAEIELEDVLEDLVIIQEAILDIPVGGTDQYCFGPAGRLYPQSVECAIIAQSPVEAVMKLAITRLALNDAHWISAHNTDVNASSWEMRTRHDWARFDVASIFGEVCDRLNKVIAKRDAAPAPSP